MLDTIQQHQIRGPREDDFNFIMATWLKTSYYGHPYFKEVEKKAFFHHYAKFIQSILLAPRTIIKVACLPDDPDIILGYAVYSDATVHQVYVKAPWRLKGIARSLLAEAQLTTCSHLTKVGNEIRKKKGLDFNPWSV